MSRLTFSTVVISIAILTSAQSVGRSQTSTDGKSIFRFDTFGDEQLWTYTLRMQQVIKNVSPRTKRLFGMPATGEHRNDKPFGIGSDGARPAFKALRCPFGDEPMGAWHVVEVGAGAGTAIAALMNGDALRAVEYLDDAAGHAHFHLLSEQSVRHRIEDDARQAPLGVFVPRCRQGAECRSLDACEQIVAADAQAAHDVIVHAFQRKLDGVVCFVQPEECLTSQPSENVRLRKAAC